MGNHIFRFGVCIFSCASYQRTGTSTTDNLGAWQPQVSYSRELELLAAHVRLAYVTIRGANLQYPRVYPRTIRGTPENMILSTMALFLQGKCTLSVGQLRDRLFEVPTGNAT